MDSILRITTNLVLLIVCLVTAGRLRAADWPAYQHDLSRSGVTEEGLPVPLHPQWSYTAAHAPAPAWPEPGRELNRLAFDYAHEVVVAGGLVYFGFGVLSTEIANELRDNPALREHIGEIQSFDVNFVASAAEEDENVYVYDVVGDKGSGTVTVKSLTDSDGSEEIIWARLRTSDGTTVELVSE